MEQEERKELRWCFEELRGGSEEKEEGWESEEDPEEPRQMSPGSKLLFLYFIVFNYLFTNGPKSFKQHKHHQPGAVGQSDRLSVRAFCLHLQKKEKNLNKRQHFNCAAAQSAPPVERANLKNKQKKVYIEAKAMITSKAMKHDLFTSACRSLLLQEQRNRLKSKR